VQQMQEVMLKKQDLLTLILNNLLTLTDFVI